MAKLEQGEKFNEAPVVDVNGNSVNPDASTQPPNAPKMGPKQIAIAAGLAVVVVIIAVVLLTKGGDAPAESEPQEQTSSSTEANFDDFDPFAPTTAESEFVGFDTPATDTQTSNSGDSIYDPYTYSIYSNEEVESLRGYGYIGDEIEYNSQQGTSYDELVDAAITKMNEANKEWRDSILDDASDGYKNLMANSYMDGKQTRSSCANEDVYSYGTKRENVDYTKCGVYNYQAWIKVQTQYGSMVLTVDLPRYSELNDSGNIVVEYKYAADESNTLLYVYDIYEVSIN